jgi:hypothetical protein
VPATEHPHSSTRGPCARPLQLAGTEVDASTGEVLDRKTVERRCGSRLASQCPSCSALYAADARALIRAGLTEPGTGRPLAATFVTLTAPGANVFGQVHSLRRSGGKRGKIRTCRCGRRHRDGDPLLGLPLDEATYRYDLAASYNAAAGRLAAVTWQKLGRILGERLRVVRVMEYQARGLVHVHALVVGTVSQADLDLVVSGGTNPRTGRRIAPVRHGRWSWGPRCHARAVRTGHADRLGAYMSKVTAYAVKAAGEDRPSGRFAEKMARAGAAGCRCPHPRPDCCDGERTSILTAADGKPVTVAWQSRPSQVPCRRHKLARRGWGYRGHVFAASRNWGTTFGELRAKRAVWAAGRQAGAPTPTPTVVLWERPQYRTHRPGPGAAWSLDSVKKVVTPGPTGTATGTDERPPDGAQWPATAGPDTRRP